MTATDHILMYIKYKAGILICHGQRYFNEKPILLKVNEITVVERNVLFIHLYYTIQNVLLWEEISLAQWLWYWPLGREVTGLNPARTLYFCHAFIHLFPCYGLHS